MNTLKNTNTITFSELLSKEKAGDSKAISIIERTKTLLDSLGDENPTKTFSHLRLMCASNPRSFNNFHYQDILLCMLQAAELGVKIGNQESVFIVPRGGKPLLELGYQALMRIALSSGAVSSIHSEIKYKDDEFFIRQDGSAHHIMKTRMAPVYAELQDKQKTKEGQLKTLLDYVDFPYCEFTERGGKNKVVRLNEWYVVAKLSGAVFSTFPEAMLQKFAIRRAMTVALKAMPESYKLASKVIDVLDIEEGFKTQAEAMSSFCEMPDVTEILNKASEIEFKSSEPPEIGLDVEESSYEKSVKKFQEYYKEMGKQKATFTVY